mmetsp:Transcript_117895/g.270451  ORF Transcript_117895/g.270451 Transcript_117895/m.270451 type:complete len:308 (+) Transcript_117895:517-1440(+)
MEGLVDHGPHGQVQGEKNMHKIRVDPQQLAQILRRCILFHVQARQQLPGVLWKLLEPGEIMLGRLDLHEPSPLGKSGGMLVRVLGILHSHLDPQARSVHFLGQKHKPMNIHTEHRSNGLTELALKRHPLPRHAVQQREVLELQLQHRMLVVWRLGLHLREVQRDPEPADAFRIARGRICRVKRLEGCGEDLLRTQDALLYRPQRVGYSEQILIEHVNSEGLVQVIDKEHHLRHVVNPLWIQSTIHRICDKELSTESNLAERIAGTLDLAYPQTLENFVDVRSVRRYKVSASHHPQAEGTQGLRVTNG